MLKTKKHSTQHKIEHTTTNRKKLICMVLKPFYDSFDLACFTLVLNSVLMFDVHTNCIEVPVPLIRC
jgi:hypothetical protein